MRREYGALDGDADPPGPSSSSGGGGWPSWWRLRRQRGGALGGFASFFGGTRESVSVANCLMEMQAAVVVSACVATLSAGLFHRDPAVKVDPSLPWSAQGSHAGANSPTFVSLVHVMAHGGYVLAAPVVGVGVELLGFPVVTALAAALCPLVASGYAAVDFTAVSRGLVRARLLAGAWKATHELSTASGNAVAFTPAASAQAFGRQAAVWSVVSVAAPFAISLLVPTLGVPGVFIALSATGFVVFCAATILVLTPWMAAGGDLPPRAPCLNVLSEEEDGDGDERSAPGDERSAPGDGGEGGEGGIVSNEAKKKAAGLSLAAASSRDLSPRSTPTESSWASTCVSMLRDPETRCVIAVSAAMGAAEYSVAGAVMMLLSGVMSFDASGCAMFLALRELPDVAVQLSATAYLRVVSVPGTFAAGLALAAGATAALAALGEVAGEGAPGGVDRRLVFAAGCAHGLGVGAVKVAALPAMSQLVEDRHGGMFGVGLGAQGFAQKLAGGAVGMVGLAVLIEVAGFTKALATFAAALAVSACGAWWFARGIALRFEGLEEA